VAISPDGQYVVYVLREGEMQSLNVRQVATGSDVQILPPDVVSFGGLTFSPVGIPRPQIGRLDQPRYPLPHCLRDQGLHSNDIYIADTRAHCW
jgi:hypothetical protein